MESKWYLCTGRCGRNRTSKCSKTSIKDFRYKNNECINIKMPSSDIQSFCMLPQMIREGRRTHFITGSLTKHFACVFGEKKSIHLRKEDIFVLKLSLHIHTYFRSLSQPAQLCGRCRAEVQCSYTCCKLVRYAKYTFHDDKT